MLELKLMEDPYCDVSDFQAQALDNNGLKYTVHWGINRDYECECEQEGVDIDGERICDWKNPAYAENSKTLENEYDFEIVEEFSEPGENKYIMLIWKNEYTIDNVDYWNYNSRHGKFDGEPIQEIAFNSYEEALAAVPENPVEIVKLENGSYKATVLDWDIDLYEPDGDDYSPIMDFDHDDRVSKHSGYRFVWNEEKKEWSYE